MLAGLLLGPPVRRWEAVQGLVAVRAMPSAPLGAVGCSVGWWDLVWPTSSSTQGDLTQDAPTPRGSVVKVSSVQLSFIRNASKKCLILQGYLPHLLRTGELCLTSISMEENLAGLPTILFVWFTWLFTSGHVCFSSRSILVL